MTETAREQAMAAMELLDNDVFRAVCRELDEALVDAWRRAKTPEEREARHREQAALADIRHKLRGRIEQAARKESGGHNIFAMFLNKLKQQE